MPRSAFVPQPNPTPQIVAQIEPQRGLLTLLGLLVRQRITTWAFYACTIAVAVVLYWFPGYQSLLKN